MNLFFLVETVFVLVNYFKSQALDDIFYCFAPLKGGIDNTNLLKTMNALKQKMDTLS